MYKYLHLCAAIRNEIRNVALFPALVLDNVEKDSKIVWLMWKTNDNAGRGGGGGGGGGGRGGGLNTHHKLSDTNHK